MCAVVRGYLLEALTHPGFACLEVVKTGCVLDGRDRCTWECTWEEPEA
jgi:predicted hydrocarbon binding protein